VRAETAPWGRPRRNRTPVRYYRGYLKPWAKRILGDIYTDRDLVRDFLLLKPKDRLRFLADLDPKTSAKASRRKSARIQAALDAIQQTVPDPLRKNQGGKESW
jgi:hypothetical protein